MTSPQPQTQRRYNSWFVTVPVLASTLAFAVWFYRPTQTQIADMRAELEAKQASLVEAASLPLKLQQTKQELAETRAFVADWRQTSGAAEYLAAVFGELASIVAAAGAKTTKLEPEPAVRCRYLHPRASDASVRRHFPAGLPGAATSRTDAARAFGSRTCKSRTSGKTCGL